MRFFISIVPYLAVYVHYTCMWCFNRFVLRISVDLHCSNLTGMEIPDHDAERLLTPDELIKYICDRKDVYD